MGGWLCGSDTIHQVVKTRGKATYTSDLYTDSRASRQQHDILESGGDKPFNITKLIYTLSELLVWERESPNSSDPIQGHHVSSGFSAYSGVFGENGDVIKWKHFPRYWPFVRGIHRSPVNSPCKGQWRWALVFSLICAWINGWVNNREAGDLRRHRAHYDVIVMPPKAIMYWVDFPIEWSLWWRKDAAAVRLCLPRDAPAALRYHHGYRCHDVI